MRNNGEAGMSLLEAIVATGLLSIALVSIAQLFALAIRSSVASRSTTYGSILAGQKLEELRATPALVPSPPDTLEDNAPGFVDYIDQAGGVAAGGGAKPPGNAIYTRRWAIAPVAGAPDTLVLQVRVLRKEASGVEGVRVLTVETRKPR